jgi:hypothetical protein
VLCPAYHELLRESAQIEAAYPPLHGLSHSPSLNFFMIPLHF